MDVTITIKYTYDFENQEELDDQIKRLMYNAPEWFGDAYPDITTDAEWDSFDECAAMFRAHVPDVLMVAGENGAEAHFPQALTPAEMELISAECRFLVDSYNWISPRQVNVYYTPKP